MSLYKWIITWVWALAVTAGPATATESPQSCEELLVQTAFATEEAAGPWEPSDTDRELLFTYKNNPVFSTWIRTANPTSFSTAKIAMLHFQHQQAQALLASIKNDLWAEAPREFDLGENFARTRRGRQFGTYERQVLSLRSGDRVKYRDHTFTLGRFVGAGNATHIYEIADKPGKVLRIPFPTRTLKLMASAKELLEAYVRHEPTGFDQRAEILEVGEGYIVSRLIPDAAPYAKVMEHFQRHRGLRPLDHDWKNPPPR